MLAVVLLLPIVIMVVACLLERFEAHATYVRPAERVRTPLPGGSATPALELVASSHGTVTDIPAAPAAGAPRELRRAS
ncbi:hypothetical protein [Actinomycetospora aeridis]|uniref:Secreted protein n=1 Tax=Actinomycetospora aeridis TaxID=3129231 RepID=A0ABU8N8H0_9PSEU